MNQSIVLGKFRRNNWIERLLLTKWFWPLFVFLGFSLPLYKSFQRELPPEKPIYFHLPQYQLTNQFGEGFGSENLKGKFYIANFIFTSCPTTCPNIIEKMKIVQKRVKGLGTNIALVTYTVDPLNDTPDVLLKFAKDNHANPNVWKFLTGSKEDLQKLLIDGFKVPMGDLEERKFSVANSDGSTKEVSLWDIAHAEKLVLVDTLGRIRGYYSLDKESLDSMMIDIGQLINRPPTKES